LWGTSALDWLRRKALVGRFLKNENTLIPGGFGFQHISPPQLESNWIETMVNITLKIRHFGLCWILKMHFFIHGQRLQPALPLRQVSTFFRTVDGYQAPAGANASLALQEL